MCAVSWHCRTRRSQCLHCSRLRACAYTLVWRHALPVQELEFPYATFAAQLLEKRKLAHFVPRLRAGRGSFLEYHDSGVLSLAKVRMHHRDAYIGYRCYYW